MIDEKVHETVGSTTTALAEESAGIRIAGYAAPAARAPLGPFTFERRSPGPKDVLIDILYCGVCHTDIHQVRDEWGGGRGFFPMVPGHEIIGRVAQAGEAVTRWKTGDTVGVGCLVDSCRECEACRAGAE
ncbi:MAG TPA: alcohol dehydrogenase catalytic domain-containing protein, partial [Thermoanaerobaculia bacterium]